MPQTANLSREGFGHGDSAEQDVGSHNRPKSPKISELTIMRIANLSPSNPEGTNTSAM